VACTPPEVRDPLTKSYDYQLRAECQQRTGETWPLNIGQVCTTLTRLERDGLVEVVVEQAVSDVAGHGGVGEPLASDRTHVSHRATEAGRGEVSEWFATPVPRSQPPQRRARDHARHRRDAARRRADDHLSD